MKILVLGAGRMGTAAAYDLLHSRGVERVTLAESDTARLRAARVWLRTKHLVTRRLDVGSVRAVVNVMRGHDAVLSAVPYRLNLQLARAAIAARVSFCDLGGNHDVVEQQLRLDAAARRNQIAILPDCGLSPGLASVLVAHGTQKFSRLERIHIRVGGLPQKPQPPLDYQLFFSVEGLINEYIEPSRIIHGGKLREVESLTGLEAILFPEPFGRLEAFYTSGGTSTLTTTFLGRVQELDEKTIRYPGHCQKVKLLAELGLMSAEPIRVAGRMVRPRALLEQLLEEKLGGDGPDVVLLRIVVVGRMGTRRHTLNYELIDRYDPRTGLTAMMRTTAFPASVAAQMLAQKMIPPGAHRQEIAVPTAWFLAEMARRGFEIRETMR